MQLYAARSLYCQPSTLYPWTLMNNVCPTKGLICPRLAVPHFNLSFGSSDFCPTWVVYFYYSKFDVKFFEHDGFSYWLNLLSLYKLFLLLFSANGYLSSIHQKSILKKSIAYTKLFKYYTKHSKIFNKKMRLEIFLILRKNLFL